MLSLTGEKDDLASPLAVDRSRPNAKYLPIVRLLESLEEQYHNGRAIASGECLQLFMLGADEGFRGCGIGRGLVRASLDNGLDKGLTTVATLVAMYVHKYTFVATI